MSINYENSSKCCFTGYRPDKFPFKLKKGDLRYENMENALVEVILKLAEQNCRIFYTGMAMGFDLIAAETVLALKNAFNPPLKLIGVIPFAGQSNHFPELWREHFNKVLQGADETVTLSDTYFNGCFQTRNKYMVDNSDYVITWYDGQRGGTANTLKYAERTGRQVFNINRENSNRSVYQIGIQLD